MKFIPLATFAVILSFSMCSNADEAKGNADSGRAKDPAKMDAIVASDQKTAEILPTFAQSGAQNGEVMRSNAAVLQARGHHGPSTCMMVLASDLEKLAAEFKALAGMEQLRLMASERQKADQIVATYYNSVSADSVDLRSSILTTMETYPDLKAPLASLVSESENFIDLCSKRSALLKGHLSKP